MPADRLVVATHLDPNLYAELLDALAGCDGLKLLRLDGENPWEVPDETDVLLTGPLESWKGSPARKPASWPRDLKWIQLTSAGADWMPDWLTRVAPIATARGTTAHAIAEFAVIAMLADAKRWDQLRVQRPADWRVRALRAFSDATVGIAGMGAIGGRVAELSAAFGATVLGWRRSGPVPEFGDVARLEDMIARSDHLVLALPLTPETHHIVNAAVLRMAKPGLHLVNVARGELIDEPALLSALDSGLVRAATLDAASEEPPRDLHPFYQHPRIRLSAHTSWSAPGAQSRIAEALIRNADLYWADQPLTGLFDPSAGY